VSALVPDLKEAHRFLQALEPSGRFQFQTFDDSKEKRPHLAWTAYGTLDDHAERMTALNQSGAGVFVTINRTDGGGRKAANVTGLRALFIDGDGIEQPQSYHLLPSLIIERDATHWHAYWLLADGAGLEEFTPAQKRLIQFYGADKVIHDLPRVMRLPGFWHQKSVPCEVRIRTQLLTARRSVAAVLQGLPELTVPLVDGGGAFSRATDSPAAGGKEGGSSSSNVVLPRLAAGAVMTEAERAERYALKFPVPLPERWNNDLKDLIINICSNFKIDDATAARVALDWSRRVRPGKEETEVHRSIRSVIKSCTDRGLRGNKWREPKASGSGRPLPEPDGHETRFDDFEDAEVPAEAPRKADECRPQEGETSPDSGTGGQATSGTREENFTPPSEIVCGDEEADSVSGDAVETEPDSLLPKLPRVPEGKVADWFNSTFEDELRRIGGLMGTKRDEAVISLYSEISLRMAGIGSVTKARVKEQFCKTLNIGRRDYDRALNECASAGTQRGSGGSGYIAYARAFMEFLAPKRTWKFWRQEWYEWSVTTGCYQVQEIQWVKAECGRWLSANGIDVTTKIQTDFLANLQMICIIHSDTEPNTWLGEDAWRNKAGATYLSMKNGILNLCDRAAGLLAHTAEYFTIHAAPFAFDPKAAAPEWVDAVEMWHPYAGADHQANAAHVILQDWLGYLFVHGNPHKKFLISVGEGNDGKSVYAGVCRMLVGYQNCSAVGLEQFDPNNTFGLQPMIGKMLNVIGDANHVEKVAEGTLKLLTGNDAHTFPRKNIGAVTMVWMGKIVINANATPYWRDRTNALYNRMLPLKWDTIPDAKMDTELMDKLKSELSGIFNWAMEGFDRIRTRPFVIPPGSNVWEWREAARSEAQSELAFFEQSIDYDKENLAKSAVRCYPEDLMKHYKAYAELSNYRAHCNKETLAKQLRTWLRRRMILDGVPEADVSEYLENFHKRDKGGAGTKRRYFYAGVILLEYEENDQERARSYLALSN